MVEYILSAVIVLLLVERYLEGRDQGRQIADLTKHIMAKNSSDYAQMKAADNQPKAQAQVPDDIPLDSATDLEFIKALKSS